jgi:hypothetical protein
MKKAELIRKVAEELKHIPRGSFDQNMLRATYNASRRHDLSINPEFPAKDSLRTAIEIARKDKPNFSPIYDRDFFGIWSK